MFIRVSYWYREEVDVDIENLERAVVLVKL